MSGRGLCELSGMGSSSPSFDQLERLRRLKRELLERIRGQDHIISPVVSVLERGELGLTATNRPRGSFLFLGPTGVGKTELALTFTDYLLGRDKLLRFDMSEYQTQESLAVLIGGRVGETGLLGLALSKTSGGTLLFDEIEKAHPRVLDVFLQMLDAARVTMASGETLDLSGFYIVFTSNIAAAEVINLQHSSFATMERHVLAKAQRTLRPELYARITEKLVFKSLSYEVQKAIADLHIAREVSFLKEKGYDVSISHDVVSLLMRRGFHPRLGARPLRDAIEKYLRGAVAKATLAGEVSSRMELSAGDGEVIARPVVRPAATP